MGHDPPKRARASAGSPHGGGKLKAFFEAFGVVFILYGLALVGIRMLTDVPLEATEPPEVPLPAALGIMLLFTATHGVVPVFFYSVFLRNKEVPGCGKAFVYLHMGLWYGAPAAALALQVHWLPLVGAAAHVALSRSGTRAWRFLQYGSASLSLLLFLLLLGGFKQPVPLWFMILAAVCQCLLLSVAGAFGRKLWVQDKEESKTCGVEARKDACR
ncbi:MAG: hypothetical protein NTW87_15955 [Planctomycetota bacterium]|nr:hypothetical protein [Planctomycetota bacterium]